jgi:NAD-dependent DNA ligase
VSELSDFEKESGVKKDFTATRKELLYHRYLYFVLNEPEISDAEYDQLEKQLPQKEREKLGVGSSLAESYPSWVPKLVAQRKAENR